MEILTPAINSACQKNYQTQHIIEIKRCMYLSLVEPLHTRQVLSGTKRTDRATLHSLVEEFYFEVVHYTPIGLIFFDRNH